MKNAIKVRSEGTSIREAFMRHKALEDRLWADKCAREFASRDDGDGSFFTSIGDLCNLYRDPPCVALEYDGKYITFGADHENYWCHADEVMTDGGLLDWTLHLSGKVWWRASEDGYRFRQFVSQIRKVHKTTSNRKK